MDAQDMLANAKHLSCLLCQMTRIPTVLIIDDNKDERDLLILEIEKFECHYEQCGTGEEAVELLKAKKFDVVFLDVILPKICGDEVLNIVAGTHPETHFIVVTGYPESPVISRALRSGATLVFQKPIRAETLALFFRPHHERT